MRISAPWVTFHKKVYYLFKDDPEVTVDEFLTPTSDVDDCYEFKITSSNGEKLSAIEKILGTGRHIGNIFVAIKYGYENIEGQNWPEVWTKAFEGNPLFKKVVNIEIPLMGNRSYAIFNKEIMSFFDDNLADYHAKSHFIVADVVKDVAQNINVTPCTE